MPLWGVMTLSQDELTCARRRRRLYRVSVHHRARGDDDLLDEHVRQSRAPACGGHRRDHDAELVASRSSGKTILALPKGLDAQLPCRIDMTSHHRGQLGVTW